MKMKVQVWNDETNEVEEFELPAKYEVCPKCQGAGKHMNDNIRNHAFTEEEMSQMSPEDIEDLRNGAYDVTCTKCDGKRVVEIVDVRNLDEKDKPIAKRYLIQMREEKRFQDEWDREVRMQHAMGTGELL